MSFVDSSLDPDIRLGVKRHLFRINGGSLTINGGTFIAGGTRSDFGNDNYTAITNGEAVYAASGSTFIMNGGTLTGHGFKELAGTKDAVTSVQRYAVIEYEHSSESRIEINDGIINAKAGCDAFRSSSGAAASLLTIRSVNISFDHSAKTVYLTGSYTPPMSFATHTYYYLCDPGDGRLRLSSANFPKDANVNLNGENVDPDTLFAASGKLAVRPKERVGTINVYGKSSGVMWDKHRPQVYEIQPTANYFPDLGGNSFVRTDSTVYEIMLIDESGNNYLGESFKTLSPDQLEKDGWLFDLNEKLSKQEKNRLAIGTTYYLSVRRIQSRHSTNYIEAVTENVSTPGTPVMITAVAPITEASCSVTAPRAGETASNDCEVPDTENYTAQIEGWYVGNGNPIGEEEKFRHDTDYLLKVVFTPDEDFKFDENAVFKVNGIEQTDLTAREDGSVEAAVQFDTQRNTVFFADCTVKMPAVGMHPDLTVKTDDDAEFTVTSCTVYEQGSSPLVVLTESDTYKPETTYTIRIDMQADEGMKFGQGTTFTVNTYMRDAVISGGGTASVFVTATTGREHLETASCTVAALNDGQTAGEDVVSDEPVYYTVTSRGFLKDDGSALAADEAFEAGNYYYERFTLKPTGVTYDIDTLTKLRVNVDTGWEPTGFSVDAQFNSWSSEKNEFYYSAKIPCKKYLSAARCTITEPETGSTPDFTPASIDEEKYTVGSVSWYGYDESGSTYEMSQTDTFKENSKYILILKYFPTELYEFSDDTLFYVNDICTRPHVEYNRVKLFFYTGEHTHTPEYNDRIEPTCSSEGRRAFYRCTECQRLFLDEECTKPVDDSLTIPKLAHTPGEPVREHESTFSYESVIRCTVCVEELSREFIATDGFGHTHTPGEAKNENEVPATCTKEGSYESVVRCTECGQIVSVTYVTTEKTDHTPGEIKRENVVEATCSKEGSCDEVVYCDECGEELSRTGVTLEKLPHTPGEPRKENDTGSEWDEVTVCTVCGEEISRIHEKAGHTHTPSVPAKENETPATCTADGSYDEVVYCTECGEEISRKTVTTKKLPHTPGEPVKENETETGYDEVVKCTVCGEEISRVHKDTSHTHTPGEPVKENETETGYDEVVKCTVCGEEISRVHKDKTPSESKGIYGDVDRDGQITANDALMILRASTGMETFDAALEKIGDVDGDGLITAGDALAVLRASALFEDEGSRVGKPIED